MGVNDVPPMPPRFVTDITPPDISSRLSFLSRAFCESVPSSIAICVMVFVVTSRMTGTSSPFGRIDGDADVAILLVDDRLVRHVH